MSRFRTGASVMELLVALGLLFLVGFILLGSLSTNRSSLQQDRVLHEASLTVRTLLERQVDLARTGSGYANLVSTPLSYATTTEQVYRVDVSSVSASLKRIDVSLWWAQAGSTPVIDPRRPILWKLTTWVAQP